MQVADIVKHIMQGGCDGEMSQIRDAIQKRKEYLAQFNFMELRIGDTVRFNRNTNPKYLVGLTAKLVDKKQKNVVVELDGGGVGRFRGKITTSVNLIDRV